MENTEVRQSKSEQPLVRTGCTGEELDVWRDVLAQATTGELIGALNYEMLAEICEDAEERVEAREHALSERGHAARFTAVGRDLGIDIRVNLEGTYWKRIRDTFVSRARANDFVGCVIAQEVILESFAVASYQLVGARAPGKLGATFTAIGKEEGEHIGHAVEMLRSERIRDPQSFDTKVFAVHEQVMTALAEMVAREDPAGHCGVCAGKCVKPSLPCVGLDIGEVRGASMQRYLQTLDEIGVPGEVTLAWVAKLPV